MPDAMAVTPAAATLLAFHACEWCADDTHDQCTGMTLHPDDGGLTFCDCESEAEHG